MDLTQFKEDQKKVRREVTGKMVASLLAAFGFVLALAWNDAIKSTIESIFPVGSGGLVTKFIYAVLLTAAVAIAGYYISKATSKEEGK